jgi:hypothetical protein
MVAGPTPSLIQNGAEAKHIGFVVLICAYDCFDSFFRSPVAFSKTGRSGRRTAKFSAAIVSSYRLATAHNDVSQSSPAAALRSREFIISCLRRQMSASASSGHASATSPAVDMPSTRLWAAMCHNRACAAALRTSLPCSRAPARPLLCSTKLAVRGRRWPRTVAAILCRNPLRRECPQAHTTIQMDYSDHKNPQFHHSAKER